MNTNLNSRQPVLLNEQEWQWFADFSYDQLGVKLHPNKLMHTSGRLMQRLKELNLSDFTTYYRFLSKKGNQAELDRFCEVITTNETYFLRCPAHFELLSQIYKSQLPNPFQVWSAACSSGEEAYSLAIHFAEQFGVEDLRMQLWASDISIKMLQRAHIGIYGEYALQALSPQQLDRFFTALPGGKWQVKPWLRQRVRLGQQNLLAPFTQGNLNIVFCRNVLIYFDAPSKSKVLDLMAATLVPGGFLFLGDTEVFPDHPAFLKINASVGQKKKA